MVLKGQFLERPSLVPVQKNVVLEALWHRGGKRPPALIIPPRPDEGGSMDHVVVAELAYAISHAGFPSLRFNFRGVGASQGERGPFDENVKDAEAALVVLEESAEAATTVAVAVGGAAKVALSLRELHPGLSGVALISPRGIAAADLLRVTVPLCLVMGLEEKVEGRAALSAAVSEAAGEFHLIEDTDQTFRRNLPQVGHAVARWLKVIAGESAEESPY